MRQEVSQETTAAAGSIRAWGVEPNLPRQLALVARREAEAVVALVESLAEVAALLRGALVNTANWHRVLATADRQSRFTHKLVLPDAVQYCASSEKTVPHGNIVSHSTTLMRKHEVSPIVTFG